MDVPRIIKHIMRSLGAKDVNQFDRKIAAAPPIQANVMPDEQIQQQVQAGNLQPMEGMAV
jgi:hypothetical protein